jgi:hypothetical protein
MGSSGSAGSGKIERIELNLIQDKDSMGDEEREELRDIGYE